MNASSDLGEPFCHKCCILQNDQYNTHKCISHIVCGVFGDTNSSLFTTTFSACNRTSFSKFLRWTETNVIKQNKSHYSRNLQLSNLLLECSFHNIWCIMDHCSMTTWHEISHPSCTVVPYHSDKPTWNSHKIH